MTTNPHQLSLALSHGHPSRDVVDLLHRYRPRKATRPEVMAVCADVMLQLTFPSIELAAKVLTLLAAFGQWAWIVGIELDPESLFDPHTIRRWVQEDGREWRQYRRWTAARRMVGVGNTLNATNHDIKLESSATEADPYAAADIPWIFSWAAMQGTPRHRIAANAIVAFCGGAGLTNREVSELQVGDVQSEGGTVTIRLPGERVVPVDPRWAGLAHLVLEAVDHGEGFLLSPNWLKNRSQMIRPRYGEGTRWPRPHRLRNTWIVGMLHRLPLPTVMHLSGVATVQGLLRHEKFLGPDHAAEFANIYD